MLRQIRNPLFWCAVIAAILWHTSMCIAVPSSKSQQESAAPATARSLPTLFIIGDSTVNNHTTGLLGWGDPIADHFDTSTIRIQNRARGGRSSRTFVTEGLWASVLKELQPGDFVLLQFGHNDGGSLKSNARASIKGVGDETEEITDQKTGIKETVHTYGWYLRKIVKESQAKGAVAIVLSPVPRNIWKDDNTIARSSEDYGKWSHEVAAATNAPFVNLNEIVAKRYEAMGPERVKATYFPGDHTHTNAAGAAQNADAVCEGIKLLPDCALRGFLKVEQKASASK